MTVVILLFHIYATGNDLLGEKSDSLKTQKITQRNRLELDISGGMFYIFGEPSPKLPDNATEYIKKLKTGPYVISNLKIFYTNNLAAGLLYKYFTFNSGLDTTDMTVEGYPIVQIQNNVKCQFLGVLNTYRIENENWRYDVNLTPGFFMYKDEGTINHFPALLKGNNWGVLVGNNVTRYFWNKKIALFFEFNAFWGFLSEIEYKLLIIHQKYELEEIYDLSCIDMGIGIKINFF